MGHKRTYTWKLKLQMVRLLEQGKQNSSQISQDHHVTRSLLYVWWQLYQHRCPSAHQEYDQQLCQAIQKIREAFAGYGYRRVTKALQRAGWKVNHKLVWRVMRQSKLLCHRKRRIVHTTDSNRSYQIYPNLVTSSP